MRHFVPFGQALRGQSISIALCKLIGTALASLAFILYVESFQQSVRLPFLYSAILLYDVIYVRLVYVQQHSETRRGVRRRRKVSISGHPLLPANR